ncbi:MAG TPA: sugar transferase [Chitinophagaceae bacterium]|nr:sugar transferase [Chitinophagaceae bacterium]
MDGTRFFDILISIIVLVILSPFLIIIAVIIKATSRGPIIFVQERVGKNNKNFNIYKFRTMRVNASSQGSLTVGSRDNRITSIGFFLRKFKVDELPQLFNVLKGEMSLVGPRPELRKFVDMYKPEELFVLSVKPGITDYASLTYRNENELLASSNEPEKFYIKEIMPAKIALNKHYISNKGLKSYFFIIFRTILTVFNP